MVCEAKNQDGGYLLIMLMVAVFALSIGLMIAVPVWQTVVQRDREEELIFRGNQYVEAVRLYLQKNPGRYPSSLKVLFDEKFLRKPYTDPMVPNGKWDVILNPGTAGPGRDAGGAAQQVLVATEDELGSIRNAQVMGVVSSSTKNSLKIYNEQESYDKWLFYYGQDPKKLPKIVRYGAKE